MDEHEQVSQVGRRRSWAEAQQLLAAFQTGGLSRAEFCQKHNVSLATLGRYQKRWRQAQGESTGGQRWVAVEWPAGTAAGSQRERSGVAVALRGGQRIELECGFDVPTLVQLVSALERI